MKDLDTGHTLLRANSTSDFYPFQLIHGATSASSSSSTFSTLSSSIWHSRLGDSDKGFLDCLSSSSLIQYNKNLSFVCHFFPLDKHVRLRFCNSISVRSRSFDIIYNDLWTSPVSSPSGYKYYVLFLDNYTKFLWTFPLFRKSQVYEIFVNFIKYVQTQFELNIKSFQCDYRVNLIIKFFINFVFTGVLFFVFLVPIPPLKMINWKAKFDQSIILSPCLFKPSYSSSSSILPT